MRIFVKIRRVAAVSMILRHMIGCGLPDENHSHEGDSTGLSSSTATLSSSTATLSTTFGETIESADSTSFSVAETDSSHATEATSDESSEKATEDSPDDLPTSVAPSYRIGGQVTGLAGGSLWLDLNEKESLEITSSGPFVFDTEVSDSRSFRVKVLIHPSTPKQQCLILGGDGLVSGQDIDSVRINCHVPIRNLVVMIVSGLSGKFVNAATTPNLFALKDEGIYTWGMQSALPSMSAPNWVALVSGREPQALGITDEFPDFPGRSAMQVQTIFSKIRDQAPHCKMGAFYQDPKFLRILPSGDIDKTLQTNEIDELFQQASKWMADSSPRLLVIQLADVKSAGIVHGWESSTIYSVVRKVDAKVGEFVNKLRNSHFRQYLGLIIAGDHGGHFKSFGGDHADDRSVPLLVMGPQTKASPISREVRIWDIAATVVDQLQISPFDSPGDLGISVLPQTNEDENIEPNEVKLSVRSVHTGEYIRIFSSKHWENARPISIWRPTKHLGYASVGDIVVEGGDEPEFSSLLVRDDPLLVAKPMGYELIWNDAASSSLIELGLWNPISPQGFNCLGTVATLSRDDAPSTDEIRCVDSRYLESTNKRLIWTNQGIDTDWQGGLWRCESTVEQPVFTSVFRIRRINFEDNSLYPRCFAFDSAKVSIE